MPSSILNSDDGVISGTSGLKNSGGDDGVLVFQSKGTETARINTDKQIEAAAGTVSLPSITTTGDVNTGIFFSAADTLVVTTGGTAAVTVDSGQRTKFPTTIGVGGATPSASGSGISFPATQSASSDANTLDDYEEGTWTSIMTAGSGTITVNNGASKNTYTKVGRLVTLTVATEVSSVSSPSGRLAIGGFPFAQDITTAAGIGGGAIYANGLTGDPGGFLTPITEGTTSMYMDVQEGDGTNPATDAANHITTGTSIRFILSYITN
jgi:hypothetical protein